MRANADNVPAELLCALGLDDRTATELRATLGQLTASMNGAASVGS
jgi:hypothetical protein